MARFDISQYSTVAERIDKFWAKYPDGRIFTDIVSISETQVVVRAEVFTRFDDERPTTVDYAEEKIDTSPVNRVSYVENCCTSAIGRALADLGGEFTGAKRPSAEEMRKVERGVPPVNSVAPDGVLQVIEGASTLAELEQVWRDAVAGGYDVEVKAAVSRRKKALQ